MINKVLVLDNFDSFTYNLVDFFRQLGCSVKVYRNTVLPETLDGEDFDLLVLSPGPSVPRNAGNMMAIIQRFYRSKPILGVCLGHQALVEFFGGTLANIAPVHGKSRPLTHDGRGIFTGLENGIPVARYHSWAADVIPPDLEVSARAEDQTVMGVRHRSLPIEGIQFHPESVLSMRNNAGMQMLKNVVLGKLAIGNRVFHKIAGQLQGNSALDTPALRLFLETVEEGQLSENQKQILLVSLSHRLRSATDLVRFVRALMDFSHLSGELLCPESVDICGTGGSGLPRINTSTLTALLLAHCGLKIAKHGNRAAAGRFGSFNLLEKLGIPVAFSVEKTLAGLQKTNLAFLFAPAVHPVFRHFASTRANIAVPTIFNTLGPLINPCQPGRQFIGTAFADLMDVIFETAVKMGKKHVIVARGNEGLDEISVSGPTRVLEYAGGRKSMYELTPGDFGLVPVAADAVFSANPAESLHIAQQIISGDINSEHYKLVAVNTAFIYNRFLEPVPLPEAYRMMESKIKSGALGEMLERYLAFQREEIPAQLLVA